MDIEPVHVSKPGLVVLDVVAADEATARAAREQLSRIWATDGGDRVWRLPGQPGVRLRIYAHLEHPDLAEDEELEDERHSGEGQTPEKRG